MNSEIKITAAARVVTIDIEGVIGVPESMQFDSSDQRVATYGRFEESLRCINAIDADRVVVNIRSTGGDVNDALLIYDAVRLLDVEVVTRCYGYVASAATVIAQAASQGAREISSNALYLIHCCESVCDGNSQSLSAAKELLDKSDGRIADIYAAASGREAESFRRLMNENGGRGRWLTPDEALSAGLVDRIIPSAPISNDAAEMIAAFGLPPLPRKKSTLGIVRRWQILLQRLGLSGEQLSTAEGLDKLERTILPTDATKPAAIPSRLASARATATRHREDPSAGEPAKTPNQSAYDADAEQFRQ